MKKDVSGRAADRAFETIQRVLKAVDRVLPMGPSRAEFTRSELLRELSKMGTAGVAEMGDQLSDDEKQEILSRASQQQQGNPSQPAFIPEEETFE